MGLEEKVNPQNGKKPKRNDGITKEVQSLTGDHYLITATSNYIKINNGADNSKSYSNETKTGYNSNQEKEVDEQ